jgi:1,4-alpha-glucan branching enzyme
MKKSTSVETTRVGAPGIGGVKKITGQKKARGKSARLSPPRTNATVKPATLLSEHCPPPETPPVHLEIYRPQALEVFVAGSFNRWQMKATPLTLRPDGNWAVDLMLKPGRYEYRYVVDGQWMDDPMAPRFAANPFGGLNSVMVVQPQG